MERIILYFENPQCGKQNYVAKIHFRNLLPQSLLILVSKNYKQQSQANVTNFKPTYAAQKQF